MELHPPAELALQLLFNKLHPHLEDAAHALAQGASFDELTRLHLRLIRARFGAMDALETAAGQAEDPALAEILETLAANLTPVGENYQQALTLTQLCLEEAPAELLPFAPEGSAASSTWGKRMAGFLARLEEPSFQAQARWRDVDPDIGDDIGD
jgi:hypothetical protein